MKNKVCLCIAAWIIFSIGCAGVTPTPTYIAIVPEATPVSQTASPCPTESATPEPEGEPAIVRVDAVGAVLKLMNRDETVSVIEERDIYYVIQTDGITALIEKRYVRLEHAAPYESWTGYVKTDTMVYDTAYLDGEAFVSLKLNTAVTVLDAPGDALLITWESNYGYVRSDSVMYKPAAGGGGGAGSGGGSSDGGDIQLSTDRISFGRYSRLAVLYETESSPLPTDGSFPCTGTVLADGTEVYLVILNSGDDVRVLDADDNNYFVLTADGVGTVPKRLIRLMSEAPYAEWDGFADNEASFFSDYRMRNEIDKLKRNTELRIIDDLGDCYLVEAAGVTGYVRKSQTGSEAFAAPSGGSGGGQEWTEPVL